MSVIERLKDIKNGTPKIKKRIKYKGRIQDMDTYLIDLDLLEFNPYNTRIVSDTTEYAQILGVDFIDIDKDEQQDIIKDIIWDKFLGKNKKTYKDIKENGQIEPGVVTSDGLVVDGNRRFMILKRLLEEEGRSSQFEAVILDETYTDNPQASREIKKLETSLQLATDKEVSYNPIDKYIRVVDLKDKEGMNAKDIARTMGYGDNEKEINKLYRISKLMDEYLIFHGFKRIYSRLYKTEDLFIIFENTLSLYESGNGRAPWNFERDDVQDFKDFGFYLIRWTYNNPGDSGFDPKDIRKLYFTNSRDNTIFSNKNIWDEYVNNIDTDELDALIPHDTVKNQIKEYKRQGYTIKESAEKVDKEWAEGAHDMFRAGLNKAVKKIENKKDETMPSILLEDAFSKLEQLVSDKDSLHSKSLVKISDDVVAKLSSHNTSHNKRYSDLIRKISEKIKNLLKNF